MSEWWTYRLDDFLLFSPRVYWRMFELANAALFPLPFGMLALALTFAGGSAGFAQAPAAQPAQPATTTPPSANAQQNRELTSPITPMIITPMRLKNEPMPATSKSWSQRMAVAMRSTG